MEGVETYDSLTEALHLRRKLLLCGDGVSNGPAEWQMAGPEGRQDKLRGWREGDRLSATAREGPWVWLSRDPGESPGRMENVCICKIESVCVSDAGERTNVEDLSTCSASRDGRGTAVGADDRSMGRGPRLSQSCWVVRRGGRVIGNKATAGERQRATNSPEEGQIDALGGSRGGRWVVRLSG